jgi:PadR family transcriptional regulator, regulatory protein AphA
LQSEISLTPTSYIVLGFLDQAGELTPYALKQQLEASVGNFWSLPHSQVYAEPARLAAAGYLTERQERSGRRRKRYALTGKGRKALERWRDEPATAMPELRDLSLLKLFFGGDPARIASAQLAAHREKLAAYEALIEADDGSEPRGPWLALRSGIGHEREWVRFWRSVLEGEA